MSARLEKSRRKRGVLGTVRTALRYGAHFLRFRYREWKFDRTLGVNTRETRFGLGRANAAGSQAPWFSREIRLETDWRALSAGAIVEREKFPFAAPGSPQLLRLKTQWVEDLLSYETVARQGYFNPAEVEKLRKRYSDPEFLLNIPYETDLLLIVLTFGLFLQLFGMPDL